MNVTISHANYARCSNLREARGQSAPFLLGVALSAVIWTTLAMGTMISVSSFPLSEQPTLTLTR